MYFSDKKRKSNKNRWKRQTYVFVYNSIKYFLTYNFKYFQFFKPVKSWFQVKVLLRRKYRKSNSNFIISNIFELSLENRKEDNRIFLQTSYKWRVKVVMSFGLCDDSTDVIYQTYNDAIWHIDKAIQKFYHFLLNCPKVVGFEKIICCLFLWTNVIF